jgi:drug/metabolite transporter (DMT)-like permease
VTRLPDGAAGVGIIPLAAAWGSSFIFIRVALPALGAVGVAEARALLGGLAITLGWLSTWAVVADAAPLGAAVFSALGANYSRRYFADEDAFTQTAGQSATAAVLMIPVVIAAPPHYAPGLAEVGALVALAVVCTALAYTLFFWLVARLGPTRALTSELLVPAFAALWSWLAFGERLPGTALGGAALILGGSALAMGWRLSTRAGS